MPWSRVVKEWKGIREICRKKILEDVIQPLTVNDEWFILILDETAMDIISTCCTTEEILSRNIAVIELLEDKRDHLQYVSALYILNPTEENKERLLQDCDNSLYKSMHLAFLSAVPDVIFRNLTINLNPFMVQTFLEIDMIFMPSESQVFCLDVEPLFFRYYNSCKDVTFLNFETTAKRLTTVFSTLGEIPLIRYRRDFIRNLIFAEALQHELNLLKESFPEPKNKTRNRCQLLILDRGFDCITPLLHEFTFQAMAYDLLDIKDDIYEYSLTQGLAAGNIQSVSLSENDPFWCQLRHEHIADVAKIIQQKIETDTLMDKTSFVRKKGLPTLNETIKSFIINKRQQSFYSYRHMANECMKLYCAGINVTSQLEQDLAMRSSSEGKPITNPLEGVINVLTDENCEMYQKLRILLLYIFFTKGISKEGFDELLKASQLPFSSAVIISNVLHLDVDLFRPGKCIPVRKQLAKNDEDDSEVTYKQSRWKPLIKDIILSCVKGTLSEDNFPFLNKFKDTSELIPMQRTRYWCVDKKEENASRLVIFIAGGVTYSEMCCTYEVMKKCTGWDIFIGGDVFLTPTKFMDKLSELPSLITEEM